MSLTQGSRHKSDLVTRLSDPLGLHGFPGFHIMLPSLVVAFRAICHILCMGQLGIIGLHADHPVWLVQLVQLAMDRRAREREQASLAISALAGAGLQEKQLIFAFEELLLNLEVGLQNLTGILAFHEIQARLWSCLESTCRSNDALNRKDVRSELSPGMLTYMLREANKAH